MFDRFQYICEGEGNSVTSQNSDSMNKKCIAQLRGNHSSAARLSSVTTQLHPGNAFISDVVFEVLRFPGLPHDRSFSDSVSGTSSDLALVFSNFKCWPLQITGFVGFFSFHLNLNLNLSSSPNSNPKAKSQTREHGWQ